MTPADRHLKQASTLKVDKREILSFRRHQKMRCG